MKNGFVRTEFDWLSTKCPCGVVVFYKNGRVSVITAKEAEYHALKALKFITARLQNAGQPE